MVLLDGRVIADERWDHGLGRVPARTLTVRSVMLRPSGDGVRAGRMELTEQLIVAPQGDPVRPWKWTSLGLGLAVSGIGVGLLAHSHTLDSELATLNQRAIDGALDSQTYNARYDELVGRQDQMYPAGVSLMAIGGAGLVLAVVLFAIDAPITVAPQPGGGVATLRF